MCTFAFQIFGGKTLIKIPGFFERWKPANLLSSNKRLQDQVSYPW